MRWLLLIVLFVAGCAPSYAPAFVNPHKSEQEFLKDRVDCTVMSESVYAAGRPMLGQGGLAAGMAGAMARNRADGVFVDCMASREWYLFPTHGPWKRQDGLPSSDLGEDQVQCFDQGVAAGYGNISRTYDQCMKSRGWTYD